MNRQKTPITRAIVREASERFFRNGGSVVRLVPQRIPAVAIVGAKWGQFEPLAGLEQIFPHLPPFPANAGEIRG